MNADHEKAHRYVNAFKFLHYFSYALCAVAIVVGAVLFAMGHSKANDCMGVAAIMFIFACIFSNARGYHFNRLPIIELQKRVSELEAGAPSDSGSES